MLETIEKAAQGVKVEQKSDSLSNLRPSKEAKQKLNLEMPRQTERNKIKP
jgi:hypothetical protein